MGHRHVVEELHIYHICPLTSPTKNKNKISKGILCFQKL